MSIQQVESLTTDKPLIISDTTRTDDELEEKVRLALGSITSEHLPAAFAEEMSREDRNPSTADGIMVYCSETQQKLDQAVAICMDPLSLYWKSRTSSDAYHDPESSHLRNTVDNGRPSRNGHNGLPRGRLAHPPARPKPALSADMKSWLDRAEEFVALSAVNYVSQYSIHLRCNAKFLTAFPILLLMAVNAYPFQPHRLLSLFFWALSLATVVAMLVMLLVLDRDEFLSRISKSRPASFDWSALPVIFGYLIPLLGVLVSQYPDVSDYLSTSLGPFFRVFEK